MTFLAAGEGPVIGIDVGENFLDLAIVDAEARRLRLARVGVVGVESFGEGNRDRAGADKNANAIGELSRRLLAAAPELGASGAIAMVDSPRWPRDLDLSARVSQVNRGSLESASSSRAIDSELRQIVSELGLRKGDGTPYRLSLFPTPRSDFFAAVVHDPQCKPHLAALGRELFGAILERMEGGTAPIGGRILESYEAYPDLAFRVWAYGAEIHSKSAGRRAFETRARINRRLAGELGCAGVENIATLDEADAAVLALSTVKARKKGAIALIQNSREGRFALPMDMEQVERLDNRAIRGAN